MMTTNTEAIEKLTEQISKLENKLSKSKGKGLRERLDGANVESFFPSLLSPIGKAGQGTANMIQGIADIGKKRRLKKKLGQLDSLQGEMESPASEDTSIVPDVGELLSGSGDGGGASFGGESLTEMMQGLVIAVENMNESIMGSIESLHHMLDDNLQSIKYCLEDMLGEIEHSGDREERNEIEDDLDELSDVEDDREQDRQATSSSKTKKGGLIKRGLGKIPGMSKGMKLAGGMGKMLKGMIPALMGILPMLLAAITPFLLPVLGIILAGLGLFMYFKFLPDMIDAVSNFIFDGKKAMDKLNKSAEEFAEQTRDYNNMQAESFAKLTESEQSKVKEEESQVRQAVAGQTRSGANVGDRLDSVADARIGALAGMENVSMETLKRNAERADLQHNREVNNRQQVLEHNKEFGAPGIMDYLKSFGAAAIAPVMPQVVMNAGVRRSIGKVASGGAEREMMPRQAEEAIAALKQEKDQAQNMMMLAQVTGMESSPEGRSRYNSLIEQGVHKVPTSVLSRAIQLADYDESGSLSGKEQESLNYQIGVVSTPPLAGLMDRPRELDLPVQLPGSFTSPENTARENQIINQTNITNIDATTTVQTPLEGNNQ